MNYRHKDKWMDKTDGPMTNKCYIIHKALLFYIIYTMNNLC